MLQTFIQVELLFRLIIAAICGYAIGYERNNRLKTAGIRTHVIVALGAALIMIVSKYGFSDVLGLHNIALDPSRIAAQIVSGIGFLGAGMIFVRNQSVNGLTTAAGVWTTAGIGMAIGAKLYYIGIGATLLILLSQFILHRNVKYFKTPAVSHLRLKFKEGKIDFLAIWQKFSEHDLEILNFKLTRRSNGQLDADFSLKVPQDYNNFVLIDLFVDNEQVKGIEF